MNELDRVANHLQSVYRDGAWSEVSVLSLFHSFTADQAATHVIPDAHSAWEIVLHIGAWHRAIARRLSGEVVELSIVGDSHVRHRKTRL